MSKSKSKNKSKQFSIPENKLVSITQAAELNDVTRQAIYVAIKLNKLKATKDTTRWTIHLDDLEAYRKQKYSRAKSMFQGELVYDPNKGFHSVNQVANLLRVPAQKNLLRHTHRSTQSAKKRRCMGYP